MASLTWMRTQRQFTAFTRETAARTLARPVAASALLLIVVFVIYSATQPRALSSFGINSVLDEYAALALAAIGECFVVISGGYDMSVGAVMAFINVVMATYMGYDSVGFALLALVIGTVCGAVNGVLVAVLRIPSIVATLATMFILDGAALIVLPAPGGSVSQGFISALTGDVGQIPVATFILIAAGLVAAWTLRTPAGGWLFAVGASESGAYSQGLPVRRLKILGYALAGLFYGAAGVFFTAETGSGDPTIGQSFLMEAFAAVAVGGTVFGGGNGSAVASILGAFVIGIINNLLQAFGVSSFAIPTFYGVVLFLAVVMRSPRLRGYLIDAYHYLRSPGIRLSATPGEESSQGRISG